MEVSFDELQMHTRYLCTGYNKDLRRAKLRKEKNLYCTLFKQRLQLFTFYKYWPLFVGYYLF